MKISKQFFTSLIVFAVLGAGAVFLSLFFPQNPGEQQTEVTLSDRAQNAFASAEVTNTQGSYSVLQEDGTYQCEQLAGLPLSQEAFDELARECTSLSAIGPLVQDPEEPVDYGFDHPLARVQASYSDGGGILIEVGSQLIGSDQYYIRVNGGSSVYRIDRASIAYLLSDISSYLDLSLSPVDGEANALPTTIQLTRGEQTLRLDRLPYTQTDGMGLRYNYRLVGDRPAYVDPDAFNTYFDDLASLKASGVAILYPSNFELQQYGLADTDRYATLSFAMLGRQVTLRIGLCADDFYYIYREGVPAIYRLAADDAHWTGVSWYALMSRYLMAPTAESLRQIQIDADGKTYLFDLTGSRIRLNDQYLSNETFGQFYQLLCSVRAEYQMEEPLQNIPPEMTVTFVFDQPAAQPQGDQYYRTEIVRFIPYGIKRHAIEIDGVAEYAVRSNYLAQVLTVLPNLQDGDSIDPNW
ncbi:MAG TPA: DUF4340 domain-containing protein [Candidatus Pygmaiobacter gallistercoris]|nr:DUF4340 domain-containing protein [Candidatus Pygmaiobacter gallistercoris]